MIQKSFKYQVVVMKATLYILTFFSCLVVKAQVNLLQVDKLVNEQVQDNGPGISIGILQNGELLYNKQKGLASLTYQVPLTINTSFRLASVSKQFTAACIGLLSKRNLLSVEDDVRKHIPELPDFGKVIRIRHLLSHTSGIRNHNVLLDLMGFDYAHTGYTNNTIQELIFKQTGVTFNSGNQMSYTNSNYVLLALIIERVSGTEFEEFAAKELFEPLNMQHTYFQTDVYQLMPNKASHYLNGKDGFKEYRTLSVCNGAGGVVSTIDDMLIWASVFINKNHPQHFISQFLTENAILNNGERIDYARGVFVNEYDGMKTIHHGGRERGLRTQWIVLPEKETAIVIFANQDNIDVNGLSIRIIDILFPKEKQQNSKITEHIPVEKFAEFLGDYQEINSDLAMTLIMENDTIKAIANRGNYKVPLLGINVHTLCRANSPQVTYQFPTDEKKHFDMVVDFAGAKFYFEKVKFIDSKEVNLSDYTGKFYSKELDVHYMLTDNSGELQLSYPNNQNIPIRPTQKDEFGSGMRTRYNFNRNNDGEVVSFTVAAEGTVKDIAFIKVD